MIEKWISIKPANMPKWNPSTHDETRMADDAEGDWPRTAGHGAPFWTGSACRCKI